jgi:protein involved in polysaccharide export with SLBB domain
MVAWAPEVDLSGFTAATRVVAWLSVSAAAAVVTSFGLSPSVWAQSAVGSALPGVPGVGASGSLTGSAFGSASGSEPAGVAPAAPLGGGFAPSPATGGLLSRSAGASAGSVAPPSASAFVPSAGSGAPSGIVAEQRAARELPSDFQLFVETATGQMLPVYGMGLFGTGRFEPVQAAQVPDGYVVGPGDELVLQLYGAVDYADRVVVDREGRILLPRIGPVKVAGLRFSQLEPALTKAIGEVYRNFKLSVSMGRLRSIEVYVLGQARSPGRKVVGSLSTLINALFETGGPSVRGSLRGIELRRAGRVVSRIDLYEFIARGESRGDQALEPGDIIYIPPVGAQVAILGSVNEPAIYELPANGGSLQSVLALSGGLPTLAAPQKAQLERVDAQRQPARYVQDIALDSGGLNTPLTGGDIVTVFQISPQFANAVTLQGHVASPMRYAYKDGMRISDLVINNNFLVPVSYWLRVNTGANIAGLDKPEVNLEYATVQRLDPVRLRTETIPFNLAKALLGDKTENLQLKPGDLIRVYGASETTPDAFDSVMLQASFVEGNAGIRRFTWREGHRITDVIPDMRWLQEEVTRWVRTTGVAVTTQALEQGVAGTLNTQGLQQSAGARVLREQQQALQTIQGQPSPQQLEQLRQAAAAGTTNAAGAPQGLPAGAASTLMPGQSPPGALRTLGAAGSAAGSVSAANVSRLSAAALQELNLNYADIRRLDPQTLQVQLIPFNLGKALAGDAAHNLNLRPGDRISLYTKQEVAVPIAKRTRLVKVSGEVRVPGTYQVSSGETLDHIIRRAGGFTEQAYVYGTSFTRESTRIEQQRNLAQLLRTLEADLTSQATFAAQNTTQADAQQVQALLALQRQTLDRLRTVEVSGRIALDLDEKASQPSLPSLELEDGDTITVPTQTDFIGVFGAVDIASAMIYRPKHRVRDYLERAGLRPFADLENVVLLKADGTVRTARTVQGRASSFFAWGGQTGLLEQEVMPGDSVLVPEKLDRRSGYTQFMIAAKDWTQLIYQFGLGAAAFRVLQQ